MPVKIPAWAAALQEIFRSGSVSQFIIYGNIFDLVPYTARDGTTSFMPLITFLENVMLETYDTIIHYDRGKGIRVTKGDKDWRGWLKSLNYGQSHSINTRSPAKALELIDLYTLRSLNLHAVKSREGESYYNKQAAIFDFAQFIVPCGDPVQFASDLGAHVVKILSWANDPSILNSNIVTFLITEKLNDLNSLIVENPHDARIEIKLPDEAEMLEYIQWLRTTSYVKLDQQSDVPIEAMAKRLTGLSRIDARNTIAYALDNRRRITENLLRKKKKEIIEKECQSLLEFIESPFTLDMVAGHEPVKEWLRQDTWLLKRGKIRALPMGYLIVGRIGTGKTFLVECWAGELGIPCVVLKNFRSKWVGATESNLEKIFSILRALGQVVVFVDEADQMTGKRDMGGSDSGLSGRVYAALAKEMSDTQNRGKIIWVFATSRPDLLEVDLKRQGRLDVHIPLFPPQTEEEYHELFQAIAKKIKFPLKTDDLPDLPPGKVYGGNEIEGMLVRALRIYELEEEGRPSLKEILKQVVLQVRPSAHTKKMEYMDMVAVRECTDVRFLPEDISKMSPDEVEKNIETLQKFL